MVPMAVEMVAAASAMTVLFQRPSRSWGSRKMARYHAREKRSQTVKREELKLNAASVMRGRWRKAKKARA